jgi:hypothetical protein
MAEDKDSDPSIQSQDTSPSNYHAIMRELMTLIMRLAATRRATGEKIKELEASRPGNSSDLELQRSASRRKAAALDLEHILLFIHSPSICEWQPIVLERGLEHHLKDLLDALGDFEAGSLPSFFDRLKLEDGKKVTPPSEQWLRGRIAAVAEVLFRSGMAVDDACATVAKSIRIQGHRKKYGRKSERSPDLTANPGTIRDWRKKAMEGSPEEPLVKSFRSYVGMAEELKRIDEDYKDIALKMLVNLTHANPGGKDFRTPLKPSFGRKSTNGR